MPPGRRPDPRDQAFAEMYRRTVRLVMGVLARAGIRRDAERCEVAQDVYAIAYVKQPGRNPECPERAWICTIAWYVADTYLSLRRVRHEQPAAHPDTFGEPADESDSPEDRVARKRAYERAVEGMRFEDRIVLEMYEVDGYEKPEIAVALDIPEGTVASRLRRARDHLAAAGGRIKARDAHVTKGRTALPLVFPWGELRDVGGLFDDAPPELAEALWPRVSGAVARRVAMDEAAEAGRLAGAVAGQAFGAGAVLGGGVVGAVALALYLLAAKPVPSPEIHRAAEASPMAAAPVSTVAPEAAAVAPVSTATETTPRARRKPASPGVDPEEQRLHQQALVAARRHDVTAATAALDEEARRFPSGPLAREREDLRAKLAKSQAGK